MKYEGSGRPTSPDGQLGEEPRHGPVIGGVDIREVAGCTCLRLRRVAREATRLYDTLIAPTGLTGAQFGLLAQLYGAQLRASGLSKTALAERVGVDQSTLTRNLKPLAAAGLVQSVPDPADRRVHLLTITDAGRARLTQAAPLWQQAQAVLIEQVGQEAVLALNGLLELTSKRVQHGRTSAP